MKGLTVAEEHSFFMNERGKAMKSLRTHLILHQGFTVLKVMSLHDGGAVQFCQRG